ncbi:MAG TPA: D-alanyl-D-alanine carboxypeptidase [Pyrinomonadaceae bacterium]|nr:D-alanyl-D-alanine carboxypeptidase [Pyrinomonadaceae bacterium]
MPRLKSAVFVFALLAALAATTPAQDEDYAPAPLPTAAPSATPAPQPARERLVVPTLRTYPSAPAGTDAVNPDAVTILATPTPTPYQHQGVYVQTLDGKVVMEQAASESFNPASAIKLATALQALRTYGPKYRFSTVIWTNGQFDAASGTITGDLIITGRDPSFHDEHAVAIARELNRLGIRTVTGDLIVSPGFTMDFHPRARWSGERFYDTLDATRRPAAAARAWAEAQAAMGNLAAPFGTPSVAVMGAVIVAPAPANARVLATHRSSELVDVLKVLLCYSNNFMAERLGEGMGGAPGLKQFLVSRVGLPEWEVRLASTSGLGVNRLTPRSMMKVYVALREELAKHNLVPSDIMPVAGIDPGTLKKRFTSDVARGSVVGKTGTLGRTDGGASALVGEMRTAKGETLLFVIFHRRGSVYGFRQQQDALVGSLQWRHGGPAPFAYKPHALALRLADTEFDARSAAKGEYESTSN